MPRRSDHGSPHDDGRPGPAPRPRIDPELEQDIASQLTGTECGEDALAAIRDEAARNLATAKRWQAEFENYRKRQERDTVEMRTRAGERIVIELFPVIDDLDRAIDHTVASGVEGAELEQLLRGVEMVRSRILGVFAKEGVEVIDPFGQPFDPNAHHAVSQRDDAEVAEHTVLEVYQKGYRLGGRVIRPAMVVVSAGGPPRAD
jgi:molecular chaperone GrpE